MMTHDEMIEVIQAHKDGKRIEFWDEGWIAVDAPVWAFSYIKYRVAPEPPKPEYVPWETIEDVIPHYGRHVKRKDGTSYSSILLVTKETEQLCINRVGASIVFQDYIFSDGTPCGKLVEK
jgi:hypothetical protein